MKNFTLHFDYADQRDSLDRSWFGEMWFPVEKYVYQVQPRFHYPVLDPADLVLEPGQDEPELCFRDHKFEIQHMHYSIAVQLMFYFQDICYPKELDPSKSESI